MKPFENTGKCIIFSAPSGAGKTTIVHSLLGKDIGLEFSVSACSREPRPNEIDGTDYHFLGIDGFKDQIKEDDCNFWCVAFEDKDGNTIHRRDVDREEMQRMADDPDGYYKIFREFEADEMPHGWVVWPHSESKGWLDRITGQVYTGIS